ncbi:MAG: TIGR04283 family arsenosugar biosynthesis glycosyltransferase [Opitutaceae bacterium]
MKKVAGIVLVGLGVIGLLVTLPLAFFVWRMSGVLDSDEGWVVIIYCFGLPILAAVSILVGWTLRREEPIQPPEDNARDVTQLSCLGRGKGAMISIIVPVLNEAPQIRPFLRHLRARAPAAEIIVVDGGSSDATVSLATGYCDALLTRQSGRASQMNAGARIASGQVLWFVHVDCETPSQAANAITRVVADQGFVGGCFRVCIPDSKPIYRVHDSWAHWIGKVLRVRCGDHGIFCTRSAFDRVGGYRDVPLMEDVEFVRALHRLGRFEWLPERLLLSKRRHEQVGPYRYTFVCSAIVGLYCAGVGSELLAKIYARMVRDRSREARILQPVETSLFSKYRDEVQGPNNQPVEPTSLRAVNRV